MLPARRPVGDQTNHDKRRRACQNHGHRWRASGKADALATQTETGDYDALRDELSKLRAHVAGLADDLKGLGAAAAGAGKRAAGEGAERLKEEVGDKFEDLIERGGKTVNDLVKSIEERPMMAVMLAFVLGLILGRLFDRR